MTAVFCEVKTKIRHLSALEFLDANMRVHFETFELGPNIDTKPRQETHSRAAMFYPAHLTHYMFHPNNKDACGDVAGVHEVNNTS